MCTADGAAALGALTLHPHSLVVMLGLLTVACVSIYAALPVFWAVPPTHFVARASAAGIALVSSIGITSGIVNPWAIGIVRSTTGSLDDAIYILAPLLLLSGIVLLAAVRPARRRERLHDSGTCGDGIGTRSCPFFIALPFRFFPEHHVSLKSGMLRRCFLTHCGNALSPRPGA